MTPLAKAVLDIEELSPGEGDAEVIVPAEDWALLVALAKAEAGAKPVTPKRRRAVEKRLAPTSPKTSSNGG